MDQPSKQRRTGVLILIAVLLVVCAWWAIFAPHTKRYRAYKSESKIKEKLQTVKLPAGARLVEISASHAAGWPMATGAYSTESDCDSVKTYYKEEFARHGFTFRDEDQKSKSETKFVFFSAPGYDAGLSCFPPRGRSLDYMIILNWTNSRD
ncbi:MAG TPA: hypothetical protein VGP65_10140 [Candidatus Angelobacter sp.]|jgi:hypothetical protein|nr:hypothetical protein [Candidatus Angelobacter sp.]